MLRCVKLKLEARFACCGPAHAQRSVYTIDRADGLNVQDVRVRSQLVRDVTDNVALDRLVHTQQLLLAGSNTAEQAQLRVSQYSKACPEVEKPETAHHTRELHSTA